MPFLIVILVSATLFGGFIFLTTVEQRRGVRVFEGMRTALDKRVSRFTFIAEHIDFGGFFLHLIRTVFEHIAHDIAQVTLIAVRSLERLLTDTVRTLRGRREASTAKSGSQFIETISYFKRSLRRSRKEETPPPSDGTVG